MNAVSGRRLKPNPKTQLFEQIAKQPIYGTLCRKRKPWLKHLIFTGWTGFYFERRYRLGYLKNRWCC
ncbi:hypothetical protein EIKCOROL_01868 [Eikenella corrodens ATCC 23834]|uniref:Uncharacterized protein n=1 Tax=Eikenella corrodens ATCC 23834 TaxID=546274 RepID=C0DWW5_EIKCO|nr:hypothetical protein EIKCOROL_01868 [Eikenella corrodens ATCC 23834]